MHHTVLLQFAKLIRENSLRHAGHLLLELPEAKTFLSQEPKDEALPLASDDVQRNFDRADIGTIVLSVLLHRPTSFLPISYQKVSKG